MGCAKLASCTEPDMEEKMHGTEDNDYIDLQVALVDTNCMTCAVSDRDTAHNLVNWSMFVEGRHSAQGFPKIAGPLFQGELMKVYL